MKKIIKPNKNNKYQQMKKLFLILCLLTGLSISSQTFKHQASINTNTTVGLQKIEMTPSHKQFMKSNFCDVRIFDSSQVEIPYIILSEPVVKSKTDFIEYPIISQKHFGTYTEIIIENKNHDKLSNIAFNINNSDALKYCSIEGSNDAKQWYTVSALQELSLSYNENYTNQYKCIYFPLNDYAYFKLLIDDWKGFGIDWLSEAPFKVNSAGYFKNSFISGKLNSVSFLQSITTDSKAKTTTVKLTFNNNQSINHIEFSVSNPRLFLREAVIYTLDEVKEKNKPSRFVRNTNCTFELNSEKPLIFDIPEVLSREVFIEIVNNDNQALQIDSIKCKQLASYLVFDVAKNKSYTLKCGDEKLNRPTYDLINFVKESPQLLPAATLSEFKELATDAAVAAPEKKFYETKLFLWICVIIGALAIALFSYKLMKDMKGNE